ncbi:MAG: transporter [Verrucomicrobiota bacterium]
MLSRLIACVLFLAGAVSTLRAQLTEWPATVEPGRFLLEMDALSLTLDKDAGDKYTAFGAASTFLTTGLAHNWDIQVGAELFISQKYEAGGFSERNSGVGDVYVRTKYRFYENPETGTAVAILPYVKFPTNSGGVGNDATEGGVIVPWTTQLAGGFEVYAMAELDFLRNDADDGYDTYWYFSGTLRRDLTSAIGVYGELALGKSSGDSTTEGLMGVGVTLSVSDRTWWDFALYKGISRGAADWNQVVRFNFGF